MLKTIQLSLYLLLASLLFIFSCKKNNDEVKSEGLTKNEMAAKVLSWLEAQKSAASPQTNQRTGTIDTKDERIIALKEALDLPNLWVEKRNEKEEFIIVPINKIFKSKNNSDKDPLMHLIVTLKPDGTIAKGNIIQYVPKSGKQTSLPPNTISKIYNYKDIECDGQFTMLTIDDNFFYQLEFKNGKLSSVAEKKRKSGANLRATCTDWYLITTYYFDDGSSYTDDGVYIGRTCNYDDTQVQVPTDCPPNEACPGGGIEYEYLKTKNITWTVYTFPVDGATVTSYENFKGKTAAGYTYSGYFTGIKHNSDECNNRWGIWLSNYTDGNYNTSVASMRIRGTWTPEGGQRQTIENFKSWNYGQVFGQ
jgi:hypothetical protein